MKECNDKSLTKVDEISGWDVETAQAAAAKIDALARAKVKEMAAKGLESALGSKGSNSPDLGGLV